MTTKNVHWSEKHEAYPARTLPPSPSSHSVPLTTPPSPHDIMRGPPGSLHHLLHPNAPGISSFDLNYHPIDSPNDLAIVVPPKELKQPAINIPSMNIVSMVIKLNKFPWIIVIGPEGDSTYITVKDILVRIHETLQAKVTDAELLGEIPERQHDIRRHGRRADRLRASGQVVDGSCRRIDWLSTDKRRFDGLVPHTDGHSWSLLLGTS